MISGSYSFSKVNGDIPDVIKSSPGRPHLTFHPVTSANFSGGYWMNDRLPWTTDDFLFSDQVNDLLVVMSGCIYNRTELLPVSVSDKKEADIRVIADLFLSQGPDFVKLLNGDFAIFMLRPEAGQAFLFRDHIGIRPLAYSIMSGVLHFSTDIVGLCISISDDYNIDREYLSGYFKFTDYRKTPDKRVYKLPPGHYLEVSNGSYRINKYWFPERITEDRNLTHDRMLSDLDSLLRDATDIRCDRRFTAGAHVSGGLDSGYVAALARKKYADQTDFYGFSWSPAEVSAPGGISHDEREMVLDTCKHAGIKPVFSVMGTDNFPTIVSDYSRNFGFFSEASTLDQVVSTQTNLVFSGWGGDEFVSTGGCAIEADLFRKGQLKTFFRRNSPLRFRKFIRTIIICIINPLIGLPEKDTRRSLRNNARYLKKKHRKSDKKAMAGFYRNTSRRKLHLGMLDFYHLQNRCESWYTYGYCKGVEYRYPLLDRRIIEYMLRVPSKILCKTDHYRPILRLISEGILPEKVRWHRSKNDPVYWTYMNELFENASSVFASETQSWKSNPMLDFVNFELLVKDISDFNEQRLKVDSAVLFRSLVYLKAINDFTVSYRKGRESVIEI